MAQRSSFYPEEITVTASAHRGDSFALQDQSMPGTFRLEDNMGCGECLHVLGLACVEELRPQHGLHLQTLICREHCHWVF